MSIDPVARGLAIVAQNGLARNASPFYNFQLGALPTFRKALQNARDGISDAFISWNGDSTTVGAGAGTSGTTNLTAARPKSPPAKLAARLQTAFGVAGCNDSFWGAAGLDGSHTIAASTAYESRVTAVVSGTSEWGFTGTGSLIGLAERCWANTSGVGALAFTPTDTFDTIDVWYIQGSGKGTFTVDIGGAALATVNSGSPATTAVIKASVSTGAGAATGTVNIKRTTGGAVLILGAVTRNSAARKVHVLNHGWFGATSTNVCDASAAYTQARAVATIAAHLNILNIGLNDINSSVAVATWSTNVQTWITNVAAVGDVMLAFPTPQNPATRDPASLTSAYLIEAKRLAVVNNVPLVDLSAHFGSYASMVSQGGWLYDTVHLLAQGYSDVASTVLAALKYAGLQ